MPGPKVLNECPLSRTEDRREPSLKKPGRSTSDHRSRVKSKPLLKGPRKLPLFGNSLAFMRDPLKFLADASTYGSIVSLHLFGRPFYLFTKPELIYQGLVHHHADIVKDDFLDEMRRLVGIGLATSENPLWRRQRKLVAHAFTPKRVQTYTRRMIKTTLDSIDDWCDGDHIDLHRSMVELTIGLTGEALFGIDVRKEATNVFHALDAITEHYVDVIASPLPLPTWWPSVSNFRFINGVREIDGIIKDIIRHRRTSAKDRGDLISALLFVKDEEGRSMDEAQIRDECMTMFVAGHETNALALTYALYLLARHPEIESAVRDELDMVIGDRKPLASDMENLVMMQRVIKETMRLYPPVWALLRKLVRDVEIDGHVLPQGSSLLFSQWIIHRDPNLFPNPDQFIPDRWTEAFAKGLPKCAYFPFGAGPRVCIGNHMAMMELVLVMATLLQRFRFELVPGQELSFKPSVTLRPARELQMLIHEVRPSLLQSKKPERLSVRSILPRKAIPRRMPIRFGMAAYRSLSAGIQSVQSVVKGEDRRKEREW